MPQPVRGVHQQDGVVDHYSGEHNASDERLHAEGCVEKDKGYDNPHKGDRNREKDNEGVPAGSRIADPNYAWLQREVTAERTAKVRQLTEVARDLGASVAQLALAWLLRLPEISSVITGASRVSQVHENLQAAEVNAKLTSEVLARIEAILGNNPNQDEE